MAKNDNRKSLMGNMTRSNNFVNNTVKRQNRRTTNTKNNVELNLEAPLRNIEKSNAAVNTNNKRAASRANNKNNGNYNRSNLINLRNVLINPAANIPQANRVNQPAPSIRPPVETNENLEERLKQILMYELAQNPEALRQVVGSVTNITNTVSIGGSRRPTQQVRTTIQNLNGQSVYAWRTPSAQEAQSAGLPARVVKDISGLNVELEKIRHSLMRNDAGQNTIDIMRREELHLLIDTYLDEIDKYVRAKDAGGVVRTIQRYRDDRRKLGERHRRMNRDVERKQQFENMVKNGDVDGIRKFIKNDGRRKQINQLSPEISMLINQGKHREASKLWDKKMKNLENESNSSSFKRRVKNAVSNGKGFGSAFKLKFRGPSFSAPNSQWVRRKH